MKIYVIYLSLDFMLGKTQEWPGAKEAKIHALTISRAARALNLEVEYAQSIFAVSYCGGMVGPACETIGLYSLGQIF